MITTTWLVPVIAMPVAATALFIFLVGDALAIWEGDIRSFTITALIAFLVFSLVTALTTGVLQPRRPSWRLIGIPTPIARRLLWATNAMAGIYAGDLFLHHTIQLFHMPVPIRVLETSIANLAFAAVLVVFALTMLPEGMNRLSGRMVKTGLNWLRFPLLLVAILIIAATVLGYVSLGRFIAGQMMLMGAGSAAVLLVHLAIRAATAAPDKTVDVVGDDSRVWWALRRQQVADGIAIMLNAVLAAAALLLLLLSWGIPLSQLLGAMKALFFGFEIGQVRISLFRILIGIGLCDRQVRDTVIWDVLSGGRGSLQHAISVLVEAVRCAPTHYVAPLSACLGLFHWQSGDGIRAGLAIQKSLDADPEYSFSQLLMRCLSQGVSPEEWWAGLRLIGRDRCAGRS